MISKYETYNLKLNQLSMFSFLLYIFQAYTKYTHVDFLGIKTF